MKKNNLAIRGNHLSRSAQNTAAITVALACATITVSLLGWLIEIRPTNPKLALKVFTEVLRSFTPDDKILASSNSLIYIGRFLGLLTTISGIVLVSVATLGHVMRDWWTRVFRRGHVVILSDTPFSYKLTKALRSRGFQVIHKSLGQLGSSRPRTDGELKALNTSALMTATGLTRAQHVIIDAATDFDTLAIGKSILLRLNAADLSKTQTVALRVADPLLTDAIADTFSADFPNAPRPIFFDENLVLARDTLHNCPPFRIASARGHKQVHALIIGFADLGEKLLDQVMLTSIAGDLGPPVVTIVDREASLRARAFRAARPAVLGTLDIAIMQLELGADGLDESERTSLFKDLLIRIEKTPVTAIYIALSSQADTLRTVMLIRRLQERENLLCAPVFFRSNRTQDETEILEVRWTRETPDVGCEPMKLSMEAVVQTLLKPSLRDKLAMELHEVYRNGSDVSPAANKNWSELPETFRRSSIRAADHIPAKLFTLGFDLPHGDLSSLFANVNKSYGSELKGIDFSDDRLLRLAKIEHDRWMVERKLDGWRVGKRRDDKRRIHNLLVPWSILKKSPHQVEKDVRQVMKTLQKLTERADQ